MKRRWYFLPLAILLVCVVAAFAVRGTYTDISGDIDSCTYAASYDFTKAVETLGESDFSKVPQALYDGTDIVVEGTCTGRSITPNAWFESFSVEKVHKGDASLSGQTLQILEELTLFVNVKNINTMMSAYLPLQEGERYLLLLKKVEFLPERHLTAFQESQYYPYTESALAALHITPERQEKTFDISARWKLGDFAGCDVPAGNATVLEQYEGVRSALFSMCGVTV